MNADSWRGWRAAAFCAAVLFWPATGGCNVPPLWLPDFAGWPVDPAGYAIEELPIPISASYARGNDVYLGGVDGRIYKTDDRDPAGPWVDLNSPLEEGPRMVFASSRGVLFASANNRPMWRTADGGATGAVCLGAPVWRMDEDELGNLYAGNYIKDDRHVATLYKSVDGGLTWAETYRNEANDHIHTVRWDDRAKRLYIAYGDSRNARGQACSDDRGATWTVLAESRRDGHTDVAFTSDYVIWASDDQSGRVFRVRRETGAVDSLMGRSQFMWFAVTDERQQVYVGTAPSARSGGERAALLASTDQGTTWQKLIETEPSSGPYDKGFAAESRALSAGGWLYCSGGGRSYRVRRTPD